MVVPGGRRRRGAYSTYVRACRGPPGASRRPQTASEISNRDTRRRRAARAAAPRHAPSSRRAWIGLDAQRAQPVHLAESEGDEVAELDELGLREVGVELGPQRVVGPPVVPRDGVGPVKRRTLARRRALDVLVGQEARAQELQVLVDGAALEDRGARLPVGAQ